MSPGDPAGKRILVADDDGSVRSALREILEASGAAVEEASDGDELLSRLHSARPDAMIIDVDMPGVRGDEVLRHLHQSGRFPAPCLVITGLERLPPGLARIPGVRLLRKPFGVQELRTALDDLLAAGAGSGPGTGGSRG